jgi:hypothetical protein
VVLLIVGKATKVGYIFGATWSGGAGDICIVRWFRKSSGLERTFRGASVFLLGRRLLCKGLVDSELDLVTTFGYFKFNASELHLSVSKLGLVEAGWLGMGGCAHRETETMENGHTQGGVLENKLCAFKGRVELDCTFDEQSHVLIAGWVVALSFLQTSRA